MLGITNIATTSLIFIMISNPAPDVGAGFFVGPVLGTNVVNVIGCVGDSAGAMVGLTVVIIVGFCVGVPVGSSVGDNIGLSLGSSEGALVGGEVVG
jgi:hypothetical protein